jgi:transcriptional regulator with XRE-family HTH domain
MEPNLSYSNGTKLDTVSSMVTVVHKFTARLYLREHRKKLGVRSSVVAERLHMERESLLRLERSPQNVDWAKAVAYASALGISPARLLKPPDGISLDELVEGESAETQAMAADIIRRLIHK